MSIMMINPFWTASSPAMTLDYRTSFSDTTNAASYSFPALDFGTASADRLMVVGISWSSTFAFDRSLSSATIGGVAATIVIQQHNGAANEGQAYIQAVVPTGTTGTIDITFSGLVTAVIGGVYRTIPHSTTALDSGSGTAGINATVTDIEVVSGGAVLCMAFNVNNTGAITPRYNGTDTPVSDLSGTLEAIAAYLFWSCKTTENSTTNDPGGTNADAFNVMAVSYS